MVDVERLVVRDAVGELHAHQTRVGRATVLARLQFQSSSSSIGMAVI